MEFSNTIVCLVLLLTTFVPSTQAQWNGCLENWKLFQSRCYFASSVQMTTWNEADKFCKANGGSLVEISSKRIEDFLARTLAFNGSFWIGLRTQNHLNFSSINGSDNSNLNWGPGEPNGYTNERCTEMIVLRNITQVAWNDLPCNSSLRFICSKPRINPEKKNEVTFHKDLSTYAEAVEKCASRQSDVFEIPNKATAKTFTLGIVVKRMQTHTGLPWVERIWIKNKKTIWSGKENALNSSDALLMVISFPNTNKDNKPDIDTKFTMQWISTNRSERQNFACQKLRNHLQNSTCKTTSIVSTSSQTTVPRSNGCLESSCLPNEKCFSHANEFTCIEEICPTSTFRNYKFPSTHVSTIAHSLGKCDQDGVEGNAAMRCTFVPPPDGAKVNANNFVFDQGSFISVSCNTTVEDLLEELKAESGNAAKAGETVRKLEVVLSKETNSDDSDVEEPFNILEQYGDVLEGNDYKISEKVFASAVGAVSIVMTATSNPSSLKQVGNKVLKVMKAFVRHLVIGNEQVDFNTENFFVEAATISEDSSLVRTGTTLSPLVRMSDGSLQKVVDVAFDGSAIKKAFNESESEPEGTKQLTIALIVYKNDDLFQPQRTIKRRKRQVPTKRSVEETFENNLKESVYQTTYVRLGLKTPANLLDEPFIKIKFTREVPYGSEISDNFLPVIQVKETKCVHRNLSSGDWSDEGCCLHIMDDGRPQCACSVQGNIALLERGYEIPFGANDVEKNCSVYHKIYPEICGTYSKENFTFGPTNVNAIGYSLGNCDEENIDSTASMLCIKRSSTDAQSTPQYLFDPDSFVSLGCNISVEDLTESFVIDDLTKLEKQVNVLQLAATRSPNLTLSDKSGISKFVSKLSQFVNKQNLEISTRLFTNTIQIASNLLDGIDAFSKPTRFDQKSNMVANNLEQLLDRLDSRNDEIIFQSKNIYLQISPILENSTTFEESVSYTPRIYGRDGKVIKPLEINCSAQAIQQAREKLHERQRATTASNKTKNAFAQLTIRFLVFRNDALFASTETVSKVVSIKLGRNITIKNLDQPISTYYNEHDTEYGINSSTNKRPGDVTSLVEFQNKKCVFWNYTIQDWSSVGCCLNKRGNVPVCMCNHLTSFALIVTVYDVPSDVSLNLFSDIGCVISIISLAIVIVLHLLHPDLRSKTPTKIQIHIYSNILTAYVIFFVGVDLVSVNRFACIAVTVALHYFFLVSFIWTGIYSNNISRSLLKVFQSPPNNYMGKCLAVAYGIPFVLVAINAGLTLGYFDSDFDATVFCFPDKERLFRQQSYYISENMCWLDTPSLFGFLGIVAIVLLNNIIVVIVIAHQVVFKKIKIRSTAKQSKLRQMKITFSMSLTLGLSWIVGYFLLVTPDSKYQIILGYTFSFFTSFQAVAILYLTCIRRTVMFAFWYEPLLRKFKSPSGVQETQPTQSSSEQHPAKR